ncbi:MAG: glycosyltransferase [Thermodesulfobacteriota bacterium]
MGDHSGDPAFREYQRRRREHWDLVAAWPEHERAWGWHYHRELARLYRNLVPPGARVLELGSAKGDLLAALEPAYGLGVDLSGRMVEEARRRHPELHFLQADLQEMELEGRFDFILLSDLVNDLWDVQAAFRRLLELTTPRTRIIINTYSRLWEFPLALARKLKLCRPVLLQNWLTVEDLSNLLHLTGFEVLRAWPELLWPAPPKLLARFCNRFLVRFFPFRHLALTNFLVARPAPGAHPAPGPVKVSVIVPARNEAGNVPGLFHRTPEMGRGTELIFVEGGSRDGTYEAVQAALAEFPHREAQLFRQTGRGKGDAVRLGFSKAGGEVLMILDADMTVPPEDLPRFYDALVSGQGEFINGVRLVYPMEKEAMRFFNLLGNKFFSLMFTWLLGQPVKDTLCGTKVMWRQDYERLAANRAYFGDFDPFGDFDLLFGAARLNLKIVEIPVRYRQRTYGRTNIERWKHGWLLLKMVLFALRRVKFV